MRPTKEENVKIEDILGINGALQQVIDLDVSLVVSVAIGLFKREVEPISIEHQKWVKKENEKADPINERINEIRNGIQLASQKNDHEELVKLTKELNAKQKELTELQNKITAQSEEYMKKKKKINVPELKASDFPKKNGPRPRFFTLMGPFIKYDLVEEDKETKE